MKLRSARRLLYRLPVQDDHSDDSSTESDISEHSPEEEEWDLDEIEGLDDVDVRQLCTLPIIKQHRIVEEIKKKESNRHYHDFAAAYGHPEEFSQLSTRDFLKEAQFDNRLQDCRFRVAHGRYGPTAQTNTIRRIATHANRRFIFEQDADVMSNELTDAKAKSTQQSFSSQGGAIGRMLPGESILDGCQRLKRERDSGNRSTEALRNEEEIDVDWEDLPLPPSKRVSKETS